MLRLPELTRISAFVAGKTSHSKDERNELIELLDAELSRQSEAKQNSTRWKPRLPGNCVKG